MSDGKIFRCEFVKRSDGTVRKMLCRTGVRVGVTGRGSAYDPSDKGLLTVFDMEKRAYRTIPAENVITVKARGERYEFSSE